MGIFHEISKDFGRFLGIFEEFLGILGFEKIPKLRKCPKSPKFSPMQYKKLAFLGIFLSIFGDFFAYFWHFFLFSWDFFWEFGFFGIWGFVKTPKNLGRSSKFGKISNPNFRQFRSKNWHFLGFFCQFLALFPISAGFFWGIRMSMEFWDPKTFQELPKFYKIPKIPKFWSIQYQKLAFLGIF